MVGSASAGSCGGNLSVGTSSWGRVVPHSRDRDHVGLYVGKFGNSGAAEIKRARHGIIQSKPKFGEERKRAGGRGGSEREREREKLALFFIPPVDCRALDQAEAKKRRIR